MEGYLQLRINPWLRRLLTRLLAIVPAVIVILLFGENEVDDLLVLSQVMLSIQLGFAVIPLIQFVSDRKTMGNFTISPVIRVLAWAAAALLVYLNVRLVVEEASPFLSAPGHFGWKVVIVTAALAAVLLLSYITLHPWIARRVRHATPQVHPLPDSLKDWTPPAFRHIAIALDFSEHDQKLLAYAVGQGGADARYLLIHVVESASARLLGKESDDYETRKDQERLDQYHLLLNEKGIQSHTALGFRNRSREIARLVKEQRADMLVIGSHGHNGLKDFIYGETVNAVRHQLTVPVLVVSL
jgi:manganese transport protein